MSFFQKADEEICPDMPFDFPAVNNITIPGLLPHDQTPMSGKYHCISALVLTKFISDSQEQINCGGSLQERETFQTLLQNDALRRSPQRHS